VGGGESYGIAVDSSGNAYVTGWTSSPSFPITANAFQTTPGSAYEVAFVTVLNATGSGLIYSTYLGGVEYSGDGTVGHAIAVDGAGHVYITGETSAPDFPTLYPFQASLAGDFNAFVAELSPFAATGAGSLIYSSYLGGNDQDSGYGIAVDGTGNAYVTGSTGSSNFPTTPGVFQPSLGGSYDAFVTKIDPPAPAALTASNPATTTLALAPVPAASLVPQSGWQAADLVFSQALRPGERVAVAVQQQRQAANLVFRQGLRAASAEPDPIDQLAILMVLDQHKHAQVT
jgi:hypothetical protein